MTASPDETVTPEQNVLALLEFALRMGVPIACAPPATPGWVFVMGLHGYPVACRTAA